MGWERRETESGKNAKKGNKPAAVALYPDHCVGSIEKNKVIWMATGKNGSVRTDR